MIRKALYALVILVTSGGLLSHPAYTVGDQLDLGAWRIKSLTLDGYTYYASAAPPDQRAACKEGQASESHGCWDVGYHGSKSFVALQLPGDAEQVCVDTESGERCWWRDELRRITTDPPEYGEEIRNGERAAWVIVPVAKATRTDRPMRWRAYVRLPEKVALGEGTVTR